jgi:hypothetical protein
LAGAAFFADCLDGVFAMVEKLKVYSWCKKKEEFVL